MAIQVTSWQDLAEKTFFSGLTAKEIEEMGLSFKPGKDFSSLVLAINSTGPRAPYSYWSVVAGREDILKEYLEGNLNNKHGL